MENAENPRTTHAFFVTNSGAFLHREEIGDDPLVALGPLTEAPKEMSSGLTIRPSNTTFEWAVVRDFGTFKP